MAKNDKGTWAEESAGYKKWAEKEFGAGRYKPKKKKKLTFKDETKKPEHLGDKGSPRPAHLGDRGFKLKFGDAFRIAKKAGKKTFTWGKANKKYTTQTKKELETGVAEKEKFTREAKRKASPQSKGKKSWLKTFGESKTLKEFAKKMKARRS